MKRCDGTWGRYVQLTIHGDERAGLVQRFADIMTLSERQTSSHLHRTARTKGGVESVNLRLQQQ